MTIADAEQEVMDALAELRAIVADYRAMKETWLLEKRFILDTLFANAELRTLEIILSDRAIIVRLGALARYVERLSNSRP